MNIKFVNSCNILVGSLKSIAKSFRKQKKILPFNYYIEDMRRCNNIYEDLNLYLSYVTGHDEESRIKNINILSSKLKELNLIDENNRVNIYKYYNEYYLTIIDGPTKEIFPYGYYNKHNIINSTTKQYEDINIYTCGLDIKSKKMLEVNARLMKLVEDDKINIIKYREFYNNLDVIVLLDCVDKFYTAIEDLTYVDVRNKITSASISKEIYRQYGALDYVHLLTSQLSEKIRKALTGGRVMVNNNTPCVISDEEEIRDLDGNSLYTSAMYIMGGIPVGAPKLAPKDITIQELKEKSYFIADVDIISMNRHSTMPFANYKDEDGLRKYTNETENLKNVPIDNNTLKVYELIHGDVEYKVNSAIYFDQGSNSIINNIVSELYNLRLYYKKSSPAVANSLKVVLNAGYGLFCKKSYLTKSEIVDKSKYEFITTNNPSGVVYSEKMRDNKYHVKYIDGLAMKNNESVFKSYSHVAFNILSTSKLIMGRAQRSIEESNIRLLYSDTDSLIITNFNDEKLNNVAKLYKEYSGVDFISNELQGFKSDFEVSDKNRDVKYEIIGRRGVFIKPKCYMIDLEYKKKDGTTGYYTHSRVKGINRTALQSKIMDIDKVRDSKDKYFNYFKLKSELEIIEINKKNASKYGAVQMDIEMNIEAEQLLNESVYNTNKDDLYSVDLANNGKLFSVKYDKYGNSFARTNFIRKF
jgi:hypothetical protein